MSDTIIRTDSPVHAQKGGTVETLTLDELSTGLFGWDVLEGPAETTILTDTGVTRVEDPSRKVLVRSDTLDVLSIPKRSYQVHPYRETLLANVEKILGPGLIVAGAGLLNNGAVGFVQIATEERHHVAGLEHEPFLTAITSLDGSYATQYGTGTTAIICRNVLQLATGEMAGEKIRHTAHSAARVTDAVDALSIVAELTRNTNAALAALAAEKVTDARFDRWMRAYVPDPKPGQETKRRAGQVEKVRGELRGLWTGDERVAPWRGTALGVLQAANTHLHHLSIVRNTTREARNAENAINGKIEKADAHALRVLATV